MRKSEQLSVRVTAEEITTLRELAARQSIRLSELVRRALAEKATGVQHGRRRAVPKARQRPGREPTWPPVRSSRGLISFGV